MNASLTIRKYLAEDEQDVLALWQKCGLVVPWNSAEADIARKMRVGAELFLVGCVKSRLVATLMGGYEGHRGWINYLAVDPAMQRKGFGKMMVSEFERLLLQQGCPKVNLQVRSKNKDVVHFYQSMGYRVDDVVSLGKRLVDDRDSGANE